MFNKDKRPTADRFAIVRRAILNSVIAMFVCVLTAGIFAPKYIWHVVSIEMFIICFAMFWVISMNSYNESLTELYRIGGKANSDDERVNKQVLLITSLVSGLLSAIVIIIVLYKVANFVVNLFD